MQLSRMSMKLQNAVDYGELVCSLYYDLKPAVQRAKAERLKALKSFCLSVGIGGETNPGGAVPAVNVTKGRRVVTVLDPELWLSSVDVALEFIKDTRGLEVSQQVEGYYLRNRACSKPRPVECSEFLFSLAAEAAARGLVDLRA